MATTAPTARKSRSRYPAETIAQVRERYPNCRSIADKNALAQELGIGSLQRLYNLACRLKVTAGEDRPERDASMERALDPERRKLRENPETTGFSAEHDEYLSRHFGRTRIEVIAAHTGHTETAVAYRARQLGLRRPARHWDLEQVMDWLGVDGAALSRWGVPLLRCCDRRGRMRIVLVSTEALATALVRGGAWQRLVARGADRFFIKEIIESVLAVREGAEWEAMWVSHGHTCLNPYAGLSFGLFYDGDDDKLVGRDLTPEEISPRTVYLLR